VESILDTVNTPDDLKDLTVEELVRLAAEIRRLIMQVVSQNGGHLASNLGVVELTLALHRVFDFRRDKLVWDVGHQIYTHKILTGRKGDFTSLRKMGGMSGFPSRDESPYDLFTTGHAGTALSYALGLLRSARLKGGAGKVIAVVGDGAISSGMCLEALNNAGTSGGGLIVVLNDNKMSISNSVGALSNYLSKIRVAPLYIDLKRDVRNFLERLPIFGMKFEKLLESFKDMVRRTFIPGELFEELGFRYYGPIDGHDVELVMDELTKIKDIDFEQPVLLHVHTEKGKGFSPAASDPTIFHSAAPFDKKNGRFLVEGGKTSYTKAFSDKLLELARGDECIVAITAAMPDGTGLKILEDELPDRLFDVGICEQHAVGFAGGLARGGLKPVVAIYSTFLQRAYDQVFHDVCLQNLPIVFALDRAGVVGADGATHQGVFDVAYLRHLPNIVLMAPSCGEELAGMLAFALDLGRPCAIRYPRDFVPDKGVPSSPITLGKAAVVKQGGDGAVLSYGALLHEALFAAEDLEKEGIEIEVVNLRFAKPLDKAFLLDELERQPFVLTLEDHALAGGAGSAVMECATESSASPEKIRRIGIPDRFLEHGKRSEILELLGMRRGGIARKVKELLVKAG
jgi:1-deoxy-D-xylulose-5-phosphate synthase